LNNIEEYHSIVDCGIRDYFTVANTLLEVANQSEPKKALSFLVESEVLNNCTYRQDEFVFWPTISRYKFDRLGFSKLEDLNLEVISYLKTRLTTTKNVLFLAKYHHALWHSSIKDKYVNGCQAIENYITYISDCIKTSGCTDKDYGNLIDYLRSLNNLDKTLKHRTVDLHKIFYQVIENRKSLPAWFVFYAIEIIYPERNKLDRTFNEECFLTLNECFDREDLSSLKEDIYSLALKYGTFLNTSVLNWHDMMGYYYYKLASDRPKDKADFLIPEYYAQAINYFKLSGNSEMHSELSANFQKVKSSNELPNVSFSFAIPEEHSVLILQYRQLIKVQIEPLNSLELIHFISCSEKFIPQFKKYESKKSFLDYAQGSYYDKNNNFTHVSNRTEFIDSRALQIELFIMNSLKDTFKHSLDTNKLTADIFIEHLENTSWIGKNEESKYWVTLLKPGIISFFSLYKEYTLGNLNFNNLIITFDTLSIKIEGVIRTYAKLNNVNITKIESEKGTGGKNVETREAFMHELFTEQYSSFKSIFDEKEYEFLKYLYLKNGLNIRNDIAHSFYKPENYSIEKLLLVTLSLFRISNFKVPT
jgi:hypothetical protein